MHGITCILQLHSHFWCHSHDMVLENWKIRRRIAWYHILTTTSLSFSMSQSCHDLAVLIKQRWFTRLASKSGKGGKDISQIKPHCCTFIDFTQIKAVFKCPSFNDIYAFRHLDSILGLGTPQKLPSMWLWNFYDMFRIIWMHKINRVKFFQSQKARFLEMRHLNIPIFSKLSVLTY